MVKVIIEQSEFTSSKKLKEILVDRLAEVVFTSDDKDTFMGSEINSLERCFICSDKFLKSKINLMKVLFEMLSLVESKGNTA